LKVHFIRNMNLKNKIALSSISLVLISTILLSLFFFRYVTDEIKEAANINSLDMSVQVGNYLDEKMKGLIQRTYAMRSNDLFNSESYLSKFLLNDQPYYYAAALSQISGTLAEIRVSDNFISSVYIYTPKGDFYDLSKIKRANIDFTKTKLYDEIKKEGNFTALWGAATRDEIYIDEREVLPLVIPFKVQGYDSDCLIVINLDTEIIMNYLKDVDSEGGSSMMILRSKSNQVLCDYNHIDSKLLKDSELLSNLKSKEKKIANLSFDGDNYIVASNPTVVAPWNIVYVRSEKYLTRSMDKAKLYIFMLAGVCLVLSLLISIILSRSITKPLASLEKTIKRLTNRDFTAKFHYDYDDEVGRLGKSFNFMVEEINSTIGELNEEKNRVENEQRLKRKAELKALQAQINPHFLYNTLNSIVWMANLIHADDISKTVMALGDIFRISLSKGKEIITINDEVEHVTNYLYIQKIRYASKLTYNLNIDKEIYEFMIIKLILQPFVENAIYHGIKEKDGIGNIEIYGGLDESGKNIHLYVVDDGYGMSPAQVQLINKRLEKGSSIVQEGYGIYNVNERIKLYFGKEYGVHFSSELMKGTKVNIIIPAVKKEDMVKYV